MKRVLLLLAFTFLLALSVTFADEEFVEVDSDEFTETVGTSYEAPTVPSDRVFLFDNFNSDWKGRWIQSNNPKYNGNFRWVAPDVLVGIEGDKGLATTEGARHYGISTLITPPINLKTDSSKKSLVVQYEVKLQEKLECGGAYIKLLAQDDEFTPETLSDSSPYIIMFGPDRCGTNDKVHFIFRHQNPKSLLWEEKHLKSPPTIRNDQKTHLYTLIVHTEDNTYEILIDNASVKKGSLLEDFTPSVNPPKEIADPDDKKPEDWVDEAKIVDPSATKPEDWDENQPLEIVDPEDTKPEGWLDDAPAMIPDPNAQKPEDWDDEEDGEWEAPLIDNPECEAVGCGEWAPRTIRNPLYKGKWTAPLIPNPEYKGEWAPRQIPNPHYFEDSSPAKFPAIGALAIEIWNMQGNILFDNFLLTDDEKIASDYAEKTWRIKFQKETEKQPAPASHESPLKQYLPAGVWQFVEQTRAYLENFKELRPLLDVVDQFAIPIAATVSAVLLGSIVLCCCCMGSSKKPARVITTETEKEVEASEKDKVIQEQSSEEEEGDKKRESTSGVKKAPKENGQAKPRKSKPVKE